MSDLTDRQRLFVEHYIQCWNASEAARRAGYPAQTARQMGYENLTKPYIRAAIDARLDEVAMGTNEILGRLTDQARGSMADFLSPGSGRSRNLRLDLKKAAEADKLHLIKKYTTNEHGVSIELYDARGALELLGRHRKLFTDNVNLSGEVKVKGYTKVSPDDWPEKEGE